MDDKSLPRRRLAAVPLPAWTRSVGFDIRRVDFHADGLANEIHR
jgi:hypothetical protein